jgi:tetratricopeptide (TPR) repeat protein
LLEKTGGSPMLLRLALGQMFDHGATPQAFIDHMETQPRVAAYLLETVLQQISQPAWRLLSLVAVFRQPINLYDPSLVDLAQQFDGPYDLAAALAEVQRRHLIDHPAHAALHPLLHDHLYATLVLDLPRRQRLHRAAAEWSERVASDAVEAAHHYGQAGLLERAVDLLADCEDTLMQGGQSLAAAAVADEVLAQARRRDDKTDLLRRLLMFRGDLLVHTPRADVAEASYRAALALARGPMLRAHIIRRLATALSQRGQAAEALLLCREARAALGPADSSLLAQLATAESRAHFVLSSYDEAVQGAERALALAGEFAGQLPRQAAETRARAHHVIGTVMRIRRRFDLGLEHMRDAIAAAGQAGLRQLEYRCDLDMAGLLLAQGSTDRALARCAETLPLLQAVGDSYAIAWLLNIVTLSHLRRGELAEALQAIERACAIHAQIGDSQGLAGAENQRATVLLTLGRLAEARATIEQVLATTEATGEKRDHAYYRDTLCMIQMLEGNPAAAKATLRELLGLPAVAGDAKLQLDLLNDLALALLMLGELAEAQQILDAPPPQGAGLSPGLERQLLQGLAQLAHGDAAGAAALAADIAEAADEAGLRLRRMAAGRLAAAAISPPPLSRLPWLLWVIDSSIS